MEWASTELYFLAVRLSNSQIYGLYLLLLRVERAQYLDAFHSSRCATRKGLEHLLAADAKGAQPMEDWAVKFAARRKFWINMQRISVTIQAVQCSLVHRRLLLDRGIWCPLWDMILSHRTLSPPA